MLLGYITNGLEHVSPVEAIELPHAIGYRGIGFTLDQGLRGPFAADFNSELDHVANRLREIGIRSAIATGDWAQRSLSRLHSRGPSAAVCHGHADE